ncbi:phosphotransferase [Halocatena halophila]|uniref:phosphotransferase n=1 Tax=Halocatena halophila TaxID=2814576 RepID=UPI002ED08969
MVKFGTHHSANHLRAGVAATELLAHWTTLPVPTVHATAFEDSPPSVIMDRCPGTPLADGFDDTERLTAPSAVRTLGRVIRDCWTVPASTLEGYGRIRSLEGTADSPRVGAEHETFRSWVRAYANRCYGSPAAHDALETSAPDVLEYLCNRTAVLPESPPQSLIVTDLSPENLLTLDGMPPASPTELTGFVDLDGAKIGPLEFAAVNVEYSAHARRGRPPTDSSRAVRPTTDRPG